MANDLSAAVSMLKNLLDTPEGAGAIGSVIEALGASGEDGGGEDDKDSGGLSLDGLDMTAVNRAMQIASAYSDINKKPDDRVNLLLAIRPYMRPERRESVEKAIKLLGIYRLLPLLSDFKDLI